jgi:methyl-accepting chemotaxis protein
MVLLIVLALFVSSKDRTGAGADVQYAGYIWTLIGVAAILRGIKADGTSADSLTIFLNGAGLAVYTSILGWTVGRALESRSKLDYMGAAQAVADDLARTLKKLNENLESAGNELVAAMEGVVDNVREFKAEAAKTLEVLEALSKELTASATQLDKSVRDAESTFGMIAIDSERFRSAVAGGLSDVVNGVKSVIDVVESGTAIGKSIGSVSVEINSLADSVHKAVDQSQAVIDQVGRFIDTVFEGRGKPKL